jgi:hypothetical protein
LIASQIQTDDCSRLSFISSSSSLSDGSSSCLSFISQFQTEADLQHLLSTTEATNDPTSPTTTEASVDLPLRSTATVADRSTATVAATTAGATDNPTSPSSPTTEASVDLPLRLTATVANRLTATVADLPLRSTATVASAPRRPSTASPTAVVALRRCHFVAFLPLIIMSGLQTPMSLAAQAAADAQAAAQAAAATQAAAAPKLLLLPKLLLQPKLLLEPSPQLIS